MAHSIAFNFSCLRVFKQPVITFSEQTIMLWLNIVVNMDHLEILPLKLSLYVSWA